MKAYNARRTLLRMLGAVALAVASHASNALTTTVTLDSVADLPQVKVTDHGNGRVSWDVVAQQGLNVAGLMSRDEHDAAALLDMAHRVDDAIEEINDAGGCPTGVTRRVELGRLFESIAASALTMSVICENNQHALTLHMQSVLGHGRIEIAVSPRDFLAYANAIVSAVRR